MKTQELNEQSVAGRYRLKKAAVAAVSLSLFAVAAAVAYGLCTLQLKNVTQDILNNQREMQQSWVDKSLESIRAWHATVVEQARLVSSAEMFRLFAVDVRNLGSDGESRLSAPDAMENGDESLRNLAEQMGYMQDLLRDFARGKNWVSARIVSPKGNPFVVSKGDAPLGEAQVALVTRAVDRKTVVFGPVRALGDTMVIDLADPMYEVLGRGESVPVAVLFATLPVDRVLTAFLAQRQDQYGGLLPRILQAGGSGTEAVLLRDAKPALEPVQHMTPLADGLGFKRRQGLVGGGEAYSLGSYMNSLGWLVTIEAPAEMVDALVESQAKQIYGLGILGSLGTALLLAFIWASLVSRSHRATAQHFKHLYTLIRQQKIMLDSVNASLQAGLMLMDKNGRLQMCNPAFCQMAGKDEEALKGIPVGEALPEDAALRLMEGMAQVSASGKEGSIEISVPQPGDVRLFRVTLFPFEDHDNSGEEGKGGCVGIFQDITEFRRRAEAARERQANSIAALVRAIESVDVNLIGHSMKMEHVADLLSGAMSLPDKDRETLRLAARLSQVGKIFVPRELLTKKGKLTPEEQAEVMRAPEYAYGILRDMQFNLPVPDAVFQMGERMDGSGLPQHLAGEAINHNARILAVVNAFCAMVSPRSYRAGMQPEEAVALLMKDKGFDSQIVSALANVAAADLQQAIATADAASKKSAHAAESGVMEGQDGQSEQENPAGSRPENSAAAE